MLAIAQTHRLYSPGGAKFLLSPKISWLDTRSSLAKVLWSPTKGWASYSNRLCSRWLAYDQNGAWDDIPLPANIPRSLCARRWVTHRFQFPIDYVRHRPLPPCLVVCKTPRERPLSILSAFLTFRGQYRNKHAAWFIGTIWNFSFHEMEPMIVFLLSLAIHSRKGSHSKQVFVLQFSFLMISHCVEKYDVDCGQQFECPKRACSCW